MGTTGLVGGFFRGLNTGWQPRLWFALSGLALTILFDFLTTLSFMWVTGFSLDKLWAAYIYGAPFYAVHLLGNTTLFAVVVPAGARVLERVSFPAELHPQETGYGSA